MGGNTTLHRALLPKRHLEQARGLQLLFRPRRRWFTPFFRVQPVGLETSFVHPPWARSGPH